MAYQVTKRTNYRQGLSGSFRGIASGFALFVIATVLLFRNEGNFVAIKKALRKPPV